MRRLIVALSIVFGLSAGCNQINREDAIPTLDYANVEGSAEAHFTWMNVQFGVLSEGHVNSEGERIATVCIDINGYVKCQSVSNGADEDEADQEVVE